LAKVDLRLGRSIFDEARQRVAQRGRQAQAPGNALAHGHMARFAADRKLSFAMS